MRQARYPLNLWALIVSALIAPPTSLLLTFAGALAWVVATGEVNAMAIGAVVPMVFGMIVVTLLGFPIAAAFGAVGGMLAERVLDRRLRWPWALAGGLTAGAYVAVGLTLSATVRSVAFVVAPWAMAGNETGRGAQTIVPIVCAIIASGLLAGLVYRHVAVTLSEPVRRREPLGADKAE